MLKKKKKKISDKIWVLGGRWDFQKSEWCGLQGWNEKILRNKYLKRSSQKIFKKIFTGNICHQAYLQVHFANWAFCNQLIVVILNNLKINRIHLFLDKYLLLLDKYLFFVDKYQLILPLWRQSWCFWQCRQSPWTSVSVLPLRCPWWWSGKELFFQKLILSFF